MPKPKPGDLVRVTETDDCLIEKGSYGVIEGRVGRTKKIFSVCFNPSPLPWWNQGIINSSGGPVRIIKTEKMKPTNEKRPQLFQYFPHGIPGAGLARTKEKTMNVFEVDLTK